jgi:hypothetical protein
MQSHQLYKLAVLATQCKLFGLQLYTKRYIFLALYYIIAVSKLRESQLLHLCLTFALLDVIIIDFSSI